MDPELSATLRTGPFHHALRAAIRARGLSLQRLQHRLNEVGLHIGLGTLSYWQSGKRRPERADSLRAVAALEGVLELPERSLLVLLGPPRPRGRAAGLPRGAKSYTDLIRGAQPLMDVIDDLGPHDGRLHTISTFESVYCGPERSAHTAEYSQIVQAHQPTDRTVVVYQGEDGANAEHFTVTAMENCRIGRVRIDPDTPRLVAEVLFDRKLMVGETQLFKFRFNDPSGIQSNQHYLWVRFPARQVVIQVNFHPDALPAVCWRFHRRHEGGPDLTREEITLGPHRSIHVVATDMQPGLVGLGWDWS
ncbi:hypothetical protein GCM10010123_44440 [Pilimelia anulata]|uniref:XRE family transcriptional regulator n=1 Tax=Pilimelia anulata TaxID=53371 RepID=A0A8J3BBX1_9ACTN|nr:hypothetical protein [Pilimelia anulata]GGK09656.1 hypothetical protein GCM10010123_44440 [Pilimelia anulata]